jgi:hypothetical protein
LSKFEILERTRIMTTVQIELPDTTANAARAAGLLSSQALDRLLSDALRRQAALDSLLQVAGRVEVAGVSPLSGQDIAAEIKAVRAQRSASRS